MNEQQIQEATTRREQQEAALLRPDGTKLYGEQEDKERRSAIRRSFEAEMERVTAGIEERAEQASRELESLEHADPAGGLSTEELQRAAAMNAFVGAEVEGLSTQNLARHAKRCLTGERRQRVEADLLRMADEAGGGDS